MIKKLIRKLSTRKKNEDHCPPTVVSRESHQISRNDISANALKVINRLTQSSFQAYLVGGSVRDLLLDSKPKDFDIATDATPEQVKTLFRNSRIIGRRFRIVHVQFGREIIEVTTFRGENSKSSQQVESDTGQLLRDNVYGNLESDALRRDFTANALYYCAENSNIYEYTTGLEDINKRQLRMIGDPVTRYKEDPVRLLRAIRFAAKLGFHIEEKTASVIPQQANLLSHIPPARLFEEVLKLFLHGYASAAYYLLKDNGLLLQLFPDTVPLLDNRIYDRLVELTMANTDRRIRSDKRVTPAFIFAAMLWPPLLEQVKYLQTQNLVRSEAFHQACEWVISRQLQHVMIPKRFLITMRQIWDLQWRLPRRQGKRAYNLMEHSKFRAAYDFLLLREDAGEDLQGLGQWWTDFQKANETEQAAIVKKLDSPSGQQRHNKDDFSSPLGASDQESTAGD
ncbi:MAG: poly(A) polymerase [Cellvibrionaceae bacterium]|jgi:poly(A) polymerase